MSMTAITAMKVRRTRQKRVRDIPVAHATRGVPELGIYRTDLVACCANGVSHRFQKLLEVKRFPDDRYSEILKLLTVSLNGVDGTATDNDWDRAQFRILFDNPHKLDATDAWQAEIEHDNVRLDVSDAVQAMRQPRHRMNGKPL